MRFRGLDNTGTMTKPLGSALEKQSQARLQAVFSGCCQVEMLLAFTDAIS
jgi:hypothetical protein